MLKRVTPGDIRDDRSAVDEITLARAGDIVRAVRQEGDAALRRFGSELDALDADTPLLLGRDALDAALASVSLQTRELLERTKSRIRILRVLSVTRSQTWRSPFRVAARDTASHRSGPPAATPRAGATLCHRAC